MIFKLESGESSEHRNNLLMLLRMLYDLSYGKLKAISNEMEKQQPSVGQRSGYNVPLERTEGRPKCVITREQLIFSLQYIASSLRPTTDTSTAGKCPTLRCAPTCKQNSLYLETLKTR